MTDGRATGEAWAQAASWFAHAGSEMFSRHFVSGLAALRADHAVAFRFRAHDGFGCLLTRGCVDTGMAHDLAERYTGGDYAADPNLPLIAGSSGEACPRIVPFDPARIGSSLYRRVFFEEPALGDKLSVIGSMNGAVYYLNLYRHERNGRFRETERELITRIAPLLLAAIACHDDAAARTAAPPPPPSGSERRLQLLSAREKDVCLLILSGMTEKTIARQLAISPHTVRTYRRRAYDKLGVEDSRALFRLLSPFGATDG